MLPVLVEAGGSVNLRRNFDAFTVFIRMSVFSTMIVKYGTSSIKMNLLQKT